jgi:hypothetical protein
VNSVLHLCEDARIRLAVATGMNANAPAAERDEAFRAAKAFAVKTYTDCGRDTDWLAQAAHFVGAAAAACLTPAGQPGADVNSAWKAAMQARMARNCEMIERQDGEEHNEAERQYGIATEFLSGS